METPQTLLSCINNPEAMLFLLNSRVPFICKRSVKTGKMRFFFYGDEDLKETIQRHTIVRVVDETNSDDEDYFSQKLLRHGIQSLARVV